MSGNYNEGDVLSFTDVDFSYPGYSKVITGLSAQLKMGEIVCVTGASGCGKSTLLNLAGGFLLPDSGSVTDTEGIVNGPKSNRIMVFQDSAQLFPWLTVRANVSFQYADDERADALLEMVGLSDAADQYPARLSGGMKQRAVIARALAGSPDILLLDEPFTALDAPTRRGLQDMLLELNVQLGVSMLFVTHDIREAVYLSDRIIIMKKNGTEVIPVTGRTGIKRGPGMRDEFSEDFVKIERELVSLIN